MFGMSAPRLEAGCSPRITTWPRLARAASGNSGRCFDERVGTDGRPERPGPRDHVPRPTTAAVAARAVAVVTLLGIAAVALPGRRGLDWDRLTDVPDVAWAQVVLATIQAALLLLVLLKLLRVWRKLRLRRAGSVRASDGPQLLWAGWLLAALLVVGSAVGALWLLSLLLRSVDDAGPRGPDATQGPAPTGTVEGLLPLLAGMVVVLAAAAALAVVLRRDPSEPDEPPPDDGDVVALAGAVTAAEQAMERYDDTRTAIIAAYTEMARALTIAAGHRPADTPTELLDRVVAMGLVPAAAARELTELFREARFSRHPLPPTARSAAEAALARVSLELAVARA